MWDRQLKVVPGELALTQEVIVASPLIWLVICPSVFDCQGCLWCNAGRFGFCLAVVSIDLEEAELRSTVICNMSHSPGYSQVIQYHFLSSPCANRHGLRDAISGKWGKGIFCSVIMCRDKWLVSRGKQMRWALELLLNLARFIKVCVHVCTPSVWTGRMTFSLRIDRENTL